MSYDLIVMDSPPESQTTSDWPADFAPGPVGTRTDLVARIREYFPDSTFDDPSWGALVGGDGNWTVEFGMGDDELVESIGLHLRGEVDAALEPLAALLRHLGLRAIDPETDSYFDPDTTRAAAQAFVQYRDTAVTSPAPATPERKRWWRRG